jgi:hypothetical protein
MHIHKTEIIEILRSRGLDTRADWVDRTLPEAVDSYENDSLLRMLGIDAAAMSPVEAVTPQA